MRLEPIRPEQLNEAQRPLFEEITKLTAAQKMGFVMARPDGALVGPFNPFLHFPQFGRAAWGDECCAFQAHEFAQTRS